ncbi:hypothetical protein [Sporosalibacterium faouarense]|uniref:hypothetical protein n=1 Tax=Sporosalibacterium faouarense TaxID=516123 RepID=UPI00141D48AC|nr:hypothetical protein [Sporosalibacterium faouarense]MTI49314.1 hypothetical protein [Bacillota bacterium]
MIVINTPLKKEVFRKVAEQEGLVYLKTKGMKLYFKNTTEEDEKDFALKLKRIYKKNRELGAIYFSVGIE